MEHKNSIFYCTPVYGKPQLYSHFCKNMIENGGHSIGGESG